MAHSKRLKDQASLAKRTATSINKLIEAFDYPGILHKSAGISQADRDALVKAVAILRRIGSEKTKAADTEKANEVQREKLIAKAQITAGKILADWPVPETNLDKVSFIVGTTFDYSLEHYLRDGLTAWNREVDFKDWRNTFNELFRDALAEIVEVAAFQAVSRDKSIEEVMLTVAEKIAAIKNKPRAVNLAEKWAAKMNP